MNKIIKGDTVCVITGKYKGKLGSVLKVLYSINGTIKRKMVIVSGVNVCKVKTKSKTEGTNFVEKELPIDVSNVQYWNNNLKKPVKLGIKNVENKKVRFCKVSSEVI